MAPRRTNGDDRGLAAAFAHGARRCCRGGRIAAATRHRWSDRRRLDLTARPASTLAPPSPILSNPSPLSSPFPDGHVLAAVAREHRPAPVLPALAQPHPGETRHQIELGGPDVAEGKRGFPPHAVLRPEVVRDEPLCRDVVLVEAEVLAAHVEGVEPLPRRETLQVGRTDL